MSNCIDNNFTNFNLIDPNCIILKDTPWYNTNDERLGLAPFEDIRSYVELKMRPKNPNFIQIENGNVVGSSSAQDPSKITLGGFYKRGDQNYYSTNYTDEIMGDNQNPNKQYEGFGIKSVETSFDPNRIPQVTIVFYDVRGNVLNNIDSQYAKMFQLPYPIFELTIKGGFGPKITYRLLKIKDDISIDEFGNYIITSKFIGDRFAPFSDLPLLYLYPVPFMKGDEVNIFDSVIESFFELINASKTFYTKLNQNEESPQELQNQKEFKQYSDQRTNYNNKLESIKNKQNFLDWFKNDENISNYSSDTKNIIFNYLNTCSFEETKIAFKPSPSIPLSKEIHGLITNIVKREVANLDDNENLILVKTTQLSIFDLTEIVKSIEFSKLIDKIKETDNQIIDKGREFDNNRKTRIDNLVSETFGSTKLTIGNIFSIIIDDYNFLMKKIKDVGKRGYEEVTVTGTRDVQIFDKVGFPTVIQDGNIIYPGQNTLFKSWPEVQFVEEFIDAYYKANKKNEISDSLLNANENGSNKYIPINPREVYAVSDNNEPTMNSVSNAYYKSSDFYGLIYSRFLDFANINLNLDKPYGVYSNWKGTQSSESSFYESMKSFFGLTEISDDKIQEGLFYSTIEMEARNIAYAISLDDKLKKDITRVSKIFNNNFFKNNKQHPLSQSISPINEKIKKEEELLIPISIKPIDDNYVTVSNVLPNLIDTASQSSDIITTYMKAIHNLNSGYKITKDNVLYIEDTLLGADNNESDYDKTTTSALEIIEIGSFYDTLKEQVEETGNIYGLYDISYAAGLRLFDYKTTIFDFDQLYYNSQYTSLIQVPRGMLIILGTILKEHVSRIPNPSNNIYQLGIVGQAGAFVGDIKYFNVKKDSKFYKYLLKEAEDFEKIYGFKTTSVFTNNTFDSIKCDRNTPYSKTNQEIISYIYGKAYISVNDIRFTSKSANNFVAPNIINGITDPTKNEQTLYVQYLEILLRKVAQFVKEDDDKLNQKLKSFESYIKDPDVKLAIYKSFQVIYENYLHGVTEDEFVLETSGEKSSFAFVDRGYNDISDKCVLDIKTLLNDVNDYEVSLFSSMSRLLSDNNFWFYPFQNFFTTAKGKDYEELFSINYDKETPIKPLFMAMYVGGLSSNPKNTNNYTVKDDSIKKNDIPKDLYTVNQFNSASTLNAFLVKFTGLQNQSVFSNFQISTESLKNTDEGLRIQSEIVSNASNSFSIPKGQSLLNVYQKQSYSSTIKIPFGNMGIQPTQYYYQEYMPLFDGLYIVYNVTHSIDADNQRLETTFKGYRLKKDTNPIVTQSFVDFLSNSVYKQTLEELGLVQSESTIRTQLSGIDGPTFVENEDFFANARRFVGQKEGFVAHCYWDINNWRIGYGSQVLALNGSLKATGDDRFNDKYFITLPNDPMQWPVNIDLDTGKIAYQKLPNGHVKDYKYSTLKAKDPKDNKYQWDAARNIKNDPYKAYVKDFYSKALSDKAFDYTFNNFLQITKKVNQTGFEKLTQKGKIAATYVSYGFGSIEPFMTKIKAAIASGNDTQLAIALIEELALSTGRWSKQIYYDTAKYIDSDIFNKLSTATKAAVKDPKYGLDQRKL